MNHIRKEFPGIVANDDITLQLKKGEIHALLGENGAGKSTLMSVLFGLYQPEAGEIKKDGKLKFQINIISNYSKYTSFLSNIFAHSRVSSTYCLKRCPFVVRESR